MTTYTLTTAGGWVLAHSPSLSMLVAQAVALRARGYPTFLRAGNEFDSESVELHADHTVTPMSPLAASVTAVLDTLRQGAA